jgi:hypothetical protein
MYDVNKIVLKPSLYNNNNISIKLFMNLLEGFYFNYIGYQ